MTTKNKIILIALSVLTVSITLLVAYAVTRTNDHPHLITDKSNQSTNNNGSSKTIPDKQANKKIKNTPPNHSDSAKSSQHKSTSNKSETKSNPSSSLPKLDQHKPITNNARNNSKNEPNPSPSSPTKEPTQPPSNALPPRACNLPEGVPCSLKLNSAKSDEFNGPIVDAEKWANGDRWDSRTKGRYLPEQCKLNGGFLYAETYQQSPGFWPSCQIGSDFSYTKHSFLVSPPAYVEFRGKLPAKGAGLHSAFWLIIDPKTNPAPYQEIDVMESIGSNPNVAYLAWHEKADGSASAKRTFGLNSDGSVHHGYNGTVDLSKSFHTYGAYFTKNTLTYYIDNQIIVTFDKNTPNFASQDLGTFAVVIDLITNSLWAGPQNNTTPNPSKLIVDYVRTYE